MEEKPMKCALVLWEEFVTLCEKAACAPKRDPHNTKLTPKQRARADDMIASVACVNVSRTTVDQQPKEVQDMMERTLN